MSSINVYNGLELSTYDLRDLEMALSATGYTQITIKVHPEKIGAGNNVAAEFEIQESNITSETLKSAIEAQLPIPSLAADTATLSCVGDGTATATVTVTDSRGASASGKTCKARILSQGVGLVSLTGSQTLDGAGQAVFTLGPTPQANMCCSLFTIELYIDGEPNVRPARVDCQFTG